MFIISTVPSQRCHHNAVLQLDIPQLEGFEKVGRHGGNIPCSLKQFELALYNILHIERQRRGHLILYTFLPPLFTALQPLHNKSLPFSQVCPS